MNFGSDWQDPRGQNVSLQFTPGYVIAHNVPVELSEHLGAAQLILHVRQFHIYIAH